jgi:cell division septum initiation protein DivIVA
MNVPIPLISLIFLISLIPLKNNTKMKKLIFLFIAASLTGSFLSAQTTVEERIKSIYYSAIEDFDMNNYRDALIKIADMERILGGTNARISFLAAQSHYNLYDIGAAMDACKRYFASNPKKDPGYDEMLRMSERISAQIAAEAQKQAEAIRSNAAKAGDKLVEEAQKQSDALVSGAKNPIEKVAKQKAGEALVKEAKSKSDKLKSEADVQANNLVSSTQQQTDKMVQEAEAKTK